VKRIVAIALAIAAAFVGGQASAASLFSDNFNRSNGSLGSPWSNTSGWSIEGGQVRYTGNGFDETVVDTGRSGNFRVEANIDLSPNRANAGLAILWKDHANYLFCKIESTPGNPSGLMSIGHRLHGNTVSLLKSAGHLHLNKGSTYHLAATRQSQNVSCTVSGPGISGGSKTISYSMNSSELSAFGSAKKSGFRGKNLHDEDDGQTRYDDFSVSDI
jgi:hypothetical protein